MNPMQEIIADIENGLQASVSATGEGCNWSLRVVSDAFEGCSRVQRQRMVNRYLSSAIASGQLHAVSLQTLTPSEEAQA